MLGRFCAIFDDAEISAIRCRCGPAVWATAASFRPFELCCQPDALSLTWLASLLHLPVALLIGAGADPGVAVIGCATPCWWRHFLCSELLTFVNFVPRPHQQRRSAPVSNSFYSGNPIFAFVPQYRSRRTRSQVDVAFQHPIKLILEELVANARRSGWTMPINNGSLQTQECIQMRAHRAFHAEGRCRRRDARRPMQVLGYLG